MCLSINENAKCPTNVKSRWKFLYLDTKTGKLSSPSHDDFIWKLNVPAKAKLSRGDENTGFHVYKNKKFAMGGANEWGDRIQRVSVVAKLKVEEFKAAGTIANCDRYSDGKPGEIWKKATVVAIYSKNTGKEIKL
jgi:hypothetical protein